MAAKAIPPQLQPEILAKAGEGLSAPKIADWLKSEHRVICSGKAVQRLLVKVAKERAPIAQAVVQEKLASTLTADLDAVEGILARALEDEAAARAALLGQGKANEKPADGKPEEPGHETETSLAPGTEEWKRCMDAASRARNDAMRVVEHRAKLSGAAPEGGDLEAAKARLLAKLKSAEADG